MEFQISANEEEEEDDEYDFQIRRYNNKVSMIRKLIMKQDTNFILVNKGSLFYENKYNLFDDDYIDDDDDDMVPPHMIIRWRIVKRMMAFLVCIGYGGTLKRRNRSQGT
ncbi:hypothetical protein R3W88_031952 [Solanum pinnatisectum]|uniref:Uncharacterized protein n=1 Tax=Solanum pinnatisectum TaxID=50273 RepID=A0AAV9LQF5_9SOLN|nr:hypothetical protein R3W88_031952 [Solanum pinnatisectum]